MCVRVVCMCVCVLLFITAQLSDIVFANSKFKPKVFCLTASDPLNVSSLMVGRITNSAVEFQVKRNDAIARNNPLITGHEVISFGVPMIGEYDNEGSVRSWKTVTISPAVPGAQYRITAWALGDGRRSATPAVEYVTTGEACECDMHKMPVIPILTIMYKV